MSPHHFAQAQADAPRLRPHDTLREFLEQSPFAMLISDGQRIQFANPAASTLFRPVEGLRLEAFTLADLFEQESRQQLESMFQANGRELPGDTGLRAMDIVRLDGSAGRVQVGVVRASDRDQREIVILAHDISAQEAERRSLARSREQLRRLAARLVDVREDERRRIARELHDDLGQRLSWLKMELTDLGLGSDAQAKPHRIAAMLELLDETMRSLRGIASDLRPLMLDDLGLIAAIEWLAGESARRMGIEVTVRHLCDEPRISDACATALFRIVQEALSNIARHAQATDVCIEISTDCETDHLVLSVTDNGVGFPPSALQMQSSLGLLGMEERVLLLGGGLKLDNPPESGARVSVWLPMDQAPQPKDGPR